MHLKESTEVVLTSDHVVLGGFPGTSHREETPGKTQDSLEGLCVPSIPQNEQEGVAEETNVWGSLLDLMHSQADFG